jgi:hypothetical protein
MTFLLYGAYRNTGPGRRANRAVSKVAPYGRLNYAENSPFACVPMASPLQRRLKSRDDALGQIAAQIVRVKRRLNSLAIQQMVFSIVGMLIGAGGIIVIAAFLLSSIHFLALGLVLALLLLVLLPLAVARTLRRFAPFVRTAAIADERAALNYRLSTLLSTAPDEDKHSLWPFLVEDTVSRLDDFGPDRVQKRRISRSIYGFGAACLIASLAGLMTYSARRHQEALARVLKHLTFQVDPSEIAPSDNPSGESAQVEGDPDTLRSLADRLEAANQSSRGGGHDPFNQLSHKAQDLASSLQDRLTGRDLQDTSEKVKLRLAQALGDEPPPDENGSEGNNNNESPDRQTKNSGSGAGAARPNSGHQNQEQASKDSDAGDTDRNKPPDSNSSNSFQSGGPQGPGQGDTPVPGQEAGATEEGGGESAGSGSDPDHLLGPPDAPSHKGENFEIMIDARLSDHSPIASAQPYVPPKVKTSLNQYQHPDEPLDRGTVPADDRDTVRRVFER